MDSGSVVQSYGSDVVLIKGICVAVCVVVLAVVLAVLDVAMVVVLVAVLDAVLVVASVVLDVVLVDGASKQPGKIMPDMSEIL